MAIHDLSALALDCQRGDPHNPVEQREILARISVQRAGLNDGGQRLMEAAEALQHMIVEAPSSDRAELEHLASVVTDLVAMTEKRVVPREPGDLTPARQLDEFEEPPESSNPYADFSAQHPEPALPKQFRSEDARQPKSEVREQLRIGNNKLLGEILLQLGLINRSQLMEALRIQSRSRSRIGGVLVKLGYVGWPDVEGAVRVQNKLRESIRLNAS